MPSRQFREGQAVIVELERPEQAAHAGALVAHVDADALQLDAPHRPESFRDLPRGTPLRLRVTDRTGTWFAETSLLAAQMTCLALRLTVRRPTVDVPERRAWPRAPVQVPVHIRVHGFALAMLEGVTTEVGGNGLSLDVPLPVPAGMQVDATISTGVGPVHSRGRIVRCTPTAVPSGDAPRFRIAVRFEGMDGGQRELLLGWLGQIERARRTDGPHPE